MEVGLPDSISGGEAKGANVSNRPDRSCILTVNGGSSSLKFALFAMPTTATGSPDRLLGGRIERIGLADPARRSSGPIAKQLRPGMCRPAIWAARRTSSSTGSTHIWDAALSPASGIASCTAGPGITVRS